MESPSPNADARRIWFKEPTGGCIGCTGLVLPNTIGPKLNVEPVVEVNLVSGCLYSLIALLVSFLFVAGVSPA